MIRWSTRRLYDANGRVRTYLIDAEWDDQYGTHRAIQAVHAIDFDYAIHRNEAPLAAISWLDHSVRRAIALAAQLEADS